MCVEIGGGEAIIKPGRLEPHPIQRRGQRLGNPQILGGNLDQDGRRGLGGNPKTQFLVKIAFVSQKYDETHTDGETYFKCYASTCESWILAIGGLLYVWMYMMDFLHCGRF